MVLLSPILTSRKAKGRFRGARTLAQSPALGPATACIFSFLPGLRLWVQSWGLEDRPSCAWPLSLGLLCCPASCCIDSQQHHFYYSCLTFLTFSVAGLDRSCADGPGHPPHELVKKVSLQTNTKKVDNRNTDFNLQLCLQRCSQHEGFQFQTEACERQMQVHPNLGMAPRLLQGFPNADLGEFKLAIAHLRHGQVEYTRKGNAIATPH